MLYYYLGAYSLPIIASLMWLISGNPPPIQLISGSNLLLDLKSMLFLRVFRHFGAYFAIIIGVAKKVFWFLIIIFIIILSFSHAFYLLLKPSQDVTTDIPFLNDDPNNPWNLVNKYYTLLSNNSGYDQNSYLVQEPDGNTNMFTKFPSSILAMYNFLTGNNGAFEGWVLQDDAYLVTLVIIFSFMVVVYLMNLFIGLLGNEIEKYNTRVAFLAEKAQIISEIELFYLFPSQRRWRNWFPEVLSYKVPIDDIRKKIKEIDDSKENAEDLPYISDEFRKLFDMPKKTENEKIDLNSKLQQIEKQIKNNETKLENNMKEIEKNLRDDLMEIEKKLNYNNEQLLDQMKTLLNEVKNLKKSN
ncbi:6943_t:CDS:2 [Entrophospora sp. SA101]|nr:6943_t:CDS:2 [Entrophospora sp. SA101]